MFKTHLKVALRNFRQNKIFTLINMAGLAIGISASLVIYLIVQHDFSFDKFHQDRDRIYRVVSKIQFPGMLMKNSGVPVPTGAAAREQVPGVENAAFFSVVSAKVTVPTSAQNAPLTFREREKIIYCDDEYFNIFKYNWLAGTPHQAMTEPFKVVLSKSAAIAYFGNIDLNEVIGREVIYNDSIKTTVAGVVDDFRKNTDIIFKEYISMATIAGNEWMKEQMSWDSWGSINSQNQLMLKLKDGIDPNAVRSQLMDIKARHADSTENPMDLDFTLQPLSDIHFNTDFGAYSERQAHLPTMYGLLAVAAFLLLLGCINFINLTTAQAAQRAREIGIRKTMGSRKGQLIVQFLSETLLLTFMATILSVIIAPWLLNVFKDFIPAEVSFKSLNQPHVWIFLIAITVIVGLLAGFYPALVLTKFKPVTVLKNQAFSGTNQTRRAWLRKTLTVTQFVIAQSLIIATLVVSKQIHFSMTKELGYRKDAIVTVNVPWNNFSNAPDNRRFVFQQNLNAIPEIEMVSLSSSSPASLNTNTSSFTFKKDDTVHETMVEIKYADSNYFKLYGMKLIAGAPLSQSDTVKEYVINETYAKMLGFTNPDDIVGKVVGEKNIPIVGVLADFHTKSTREEIKPLAYASYINRSYTLHLGLRADDPASWKTAIQKAEKEYKKIYPESDFAYTFYDETIAKFYVAEQRISRLLTWASGLCIFISCLGLLGLAIFVTNARVKEIGVRKVLGASVFQIVSLLSKDFMKLVLVAFVLAVPLAWYATHSWLQDFAYRTELSWWLFVVAGVGMLMISLAILSFRTIKSALENPVKSLRTE
ncbi:MAG: ABC transporter permease [Chitinophagaceae bacterium]|nr:ABC transporter permease [Chitinophagaceae bacterium]